MTVASYRIDYSLAITIQALVGETKLLSVNEDAKCTGVFVRITLYILDKPLSIQYHSKLIVADDGFEWNEVIELGVMISDLDEGAKLKMELISATVPEKTLLTCELCLFEGGFLKQGRQYCLLRPKESQRTVELPLSLRHQLRESTDQLAVNQLHKFGQQMCALYLCFSLPMFDHKDIRHVDRSYGRSASCAQRNNTAEPKDVSSLHRLCQKPPTWAMTINEKRLVWRNRHLLPRIPHILVKFIQSLDWDDPDDISEAYSIIEAAGFQTTEDNCLLELLFLVEMLLEKGDALDKRMWPILKVRLDAFEQVSLFAAQLCELAIVRAGVPSWLAENIGNWLIERATSDAALAQRLWWYAKMAAVRGSQQTGAPNAAVSGHAIFLQALPKKDLYKQQEDLVKRIADIVAMVRQSRFTRPQQTEYLKRLLYEHPIIRDAAIYLPFDHEHAHAIEGLLVDDTLIYKSRAMPVRLTFLTPAGTCPVEL